MNWQAPPNNPVTMTIGTATFGGSTRGGYEVTVRKRQIFYNQLLDEIADESWCTVEGTSISSITPGYTEDPGVCTKFDDIYRSVDFVQPIAISNSGEACTDTEAAWVY